MSKKTDDEFTRDLERKLNAAARPILDEIDRKRERAERKARAEVARRLRNRDAIPEQRTVKPLAGQMSLFGDDK